MSGAYLEILQGDDYSYSTNVTIDNVPQNLFGASVWFQGWGDPSGNVNDRQLLINASTNSGEIAISGNNYNTVTVTLNGNATANYYEANVLNWAIRCQLTTGKVYTLDRGLACIKRPTVQLPWVTS